MRWYFIEPGVAESQKRTCKHSCPCLDRAAAGLVLPELLVSLAILMLLLQGVFQWSSLLLQGSQQMQQNRQAVHYAQQVLAHQPLSLQQGWQVQAENKPTGYCLTEWNILVSDGSKQWYFYYVGEDGLENQ